MLVWYQIMYLCIKDSDFNGTINIKIYQFHLDTEFLLVRYQMMDCMDNGRNTADALLSHWEPAGKINRVSLVEYGDHCFCGFNMCWSTIISSGIWWPLLLRFNLCWSTNISGIWVIIAFAILICVSYAVILISTILNHKSQAIFVLLLGKGFHTRTNERVIFLWTKL